MGERWGWIKRGKEGAADIHPPRKQYWLDEDKENYERRQRGTRGGGKAWGAGERKWRHLLGEGQGEPGGECCSLRLEGFEGIGLFELRSRELVEPRLFIAVGVLEDIRKGLEKKRAVGVV